MSGKTRDKLVRENELLQEQIDKYREILRMDAERHQEALACANGTLRLVASERARLSMELDEITRRSSDEKKMVLGLLRDNARLQGRIEGLERGFVIGSGGARLTEFQGTKAELREDTDAHAGGRS